MKSAKLIQSSRSGLKELDILLQNYLNPLPKEFDHKTFLELMQWDDQTLLANIIEPKHQLTKAQKKICHSIAQAMP